VFYCVNYISLVRNYIAHSWCLRLISVLIHACIWFLFVLLFMKPEVLLRDLYRIC